MPAVPFSTSSAPGLLAGESEGRLVNCYAERTGRETVQFRRVPGLGSVTNTGMSVPRGMIDVGGIVYAAYAGGVAQINPDGSVAALAGALPGSDGVTWARNNRTAGGLPATDIVAVRESGGAYALSAGSVLAYPDADLPGSVNSVVQIDAYSMFTVPDGRIVATQLNALDVNPLSFATAEAKPDGLKRGIVHAGTYYAMGSNSIEPWQNNGGTPFPLIRGASVMPVGLLTTMAVAGAEEGWDHNPFFVAHDGSVREIKGYDAVRVSTPDVERFIASSNPGLLVASVYTFRGNAIWSLTSNAGTWELNVSTGQWHERSSVASVGWRARHSVKANGRWLLGDTLSTNLLTVSEGLRTEAGAALTVTLESGALREFGTRAGAKEAPGRFQIPGLFLDFARSPGAVVNVSWSLDGGATWSTPLARSLSDATADAVRINRLGLATHSGLRVRITEATAADFSFRGASVPSPEPRTP